MADEELRCIPRSLVISLARCHSYGDGYRCRCGCSSGKAQVVFFKSMMKLILEQHFDKANALEFQWPSWDYEFSHTDCVPLTYDFMHEMCRLLLIRKLSKSLRPIKILRIKGLLLDFEDVGMPIDSYRKIIGEAADSLQELHISATPMISHDQPVIDSYAAPENMWLSNPFTHLRSLSLGLDTAWGPVPLFQTKHLQFPVLETLYLHKYTLLYQSQLAWILSICNLKSLILDKCSIPWLMAVTL